MTEIIKVRIKGCDTATYGCCVAEFSHVTGFRLSLVAKSDDMMEVESFGWIGVSRQQQLGPTVALQA